jgi:nucleoside-diphosphate-sugar epimerase
MNNHHRRHSYDPPNDTLLILGLGRVGREVAQWAKPHFASVIGTVRSESLSLQPQPPTTPTTNAIASSTVASDGFNDKDETTILSQQQQQQQQQSQPSIHIIPFDIHHILPLLSRTSHVLITIPPQEHPNDQMVLDQVYLQILQSLGHHRDSSCRWMGIISTAGVYGDHQGAWVREEDDDDDDDEEDTTTRTFLCPTDETAKRYLAYEELWKQQFLAATSTTTNIATGHHHRQQQQQQQQQLRIFRCAGIYGPHQSALHTIWRQHQQQPSSLQRITPRPSLATAATVATSDPARTKHDLINRIHITDLARAVVSSMIVGSIPLDGDKQPSSNVRVYNLADDLPESRQVVIQYAMDLLESKGLLLPQNEPNQENEEKGDSNTQQAISRDAQTTSSSSSPRRGRRRFDCKRVSNQRMKQELLIKQDLALLYPTYREGLDHILSDPTAPWWNPPSFIRL